MRRTMAAALKHLRSFDNGPHSHGGPFVFPLDGCSYRG
jgi:hypothetical protein